MAGFDPTAGNANAFAPYGSLAGVTKLGAAKRGRTSLGGGGASFGPPTGNTVPTWSAGGAAEQPVQRMQPMPIRGMGMMAPQQRIGGKTRLAATTSNFVNANGGLTPDYSSQFGGLNEFYKMQHQRQADQSAANTIDPRTGLPYAANARTTNDLLASIAAKPGSFDVFNKTSAYLGGVPGADKDLDAFNYQQKSMQGQPPTPISTAPAPTPAEVMTNPIDLDKPPGRKDGGDTSGLHPYIVNEEGEEAWQPKGGKPQLMEGGEKMVMFPKDGKVIPHGRTMNMLRKGEIEHRAEGGLTRGRPMTLADLKATRESVLAGIADKQKQHRARMLQDQLQAYMEKQQQRPFISSEGINWDALTAGNPGTALPLSTDEEYENALREYNSMANPQPQPSLGMGDLHAMEAGIPVNTQPAPLNASPFTPHPLPSSIQTILDTLKGTAMTPTAPAMATPAPATPQPFVGPPAPQPAPTPSQPRSISSKYGTGSVTFNQPPVKGPHIMYKGKPWDKEANLAQQAKDDMSIDDIRRNALRRKINDEVDERYGVGAPTVNPQLTSDEQGQLARGFSSLPAETQSRLKAVGYRKMGGYVKATLPATRTARYT